MDSKLREDLERLKKIRAHRGLRHYWGLRVRGQHSKTTGRRGRTGMTILLLLVDLRLLTCFFQLVLARRSSGVCGGGGEPIGTSAMDPWWYQA